MVFFDRFFASLIGLVFLITTQVTLAQEVARPRLSPEGLGILSSVGEIAGGGALVVLGVGTLGVGAVPGAVLIGKGVLDLAVNVRNVIRIQNGGDRGAASAIGEIAGALGKFFQSDEKAWRKAGDAIDSAAAIGLVALVPEAGALDGLKLLSVLGPVVPKTVHDMTYASSGN